MIITRKVKDLFSSTAFARQRPHEVLPEVVYRHNSLIRRKLGNVDLHLQENKAVSLGIAAPLVNLVVFRPGETFSFWKLVGSCTEAKGYREGLVINHGQPASDIGGRSVPVHQSPPLDGPAQRIDGSGTPPPRRSGLVPGLQPSDPLRFGDIDYLQLLDYRVRNDTDQAYQFLVSTTEEHLCGELRAERVPAMKFHIREEDAYSHEADGNVYRHNKVMRLTRDKRTGLVTSKEQIIENNALVVYDRALINAPILQTPPHPETDDLLATATALRNNSKAAPSVDGREMST